MGFKSMYAMQTEVVGQSVSCDMSASILICSISVIPLKCSSYPCSYHLLILNSKLLEVRSLSFLSPEATSTLNVLCTARSQPTFATIQAR